MAGGARKPLKVDERNACVFGVGRAEPARDDRLLARRALSEMTAPAREGCRRPVPGLGRLALVTADHAVAEVVPVAVGALQAGRRVDVGVGVPSGLVLGRDRVAGQTAAVGRFIVKVEKVAVLGVEIDRPVLDKGYHRPFVVVEVGPVVNVPRFLEPGGHAADLADAAGRRGRPAEILAEDLFGPLAGILASRLVVAGEAVHFGFPGDGPARLGMGQDLFVGGLGRAAAGHVPSKEQGEIPGREAHGLWVIASGPFSVREGQDRPRLRVELEPWLPRPAVLGRRHGPEVPAAPDRPVVVARAAGEAGRIGQRVGLGRDDELVVLVAERDEVGRNRPVAVPDRLLRILRGGLGKAVRGKSENRGQREA